MQKTKLEKFVYKTDKIMKKQKNILKMQRMDGKKESPIYWHPCCIQEEAM